MARLTAHFELRNGNTVKVRVKEVTVRNDGAGGIEQIRWTTKGGRQILFFRLADVLAVTTTRRWF